MIALFRLIIIISLLAAASYFLLSDHLMVLLDACKTSEYLHFVISILLALDLFLSIPTLALAIFSAHQLGFYQSFIVITLGLNLCGHFGYILGRITPERFVRTILGQQQDHLTKMFEKNDFAALLLCRLIPMLPEACSLLSGVSKLSYLRFTFLWLGNVLPYAFFTSLVGSSFKKQPFELVLSAMIVSYIGVAAFGIYVIKPNLPFIIVKFKGLRKSLK